jgi:hypothetical protein
MRSDIVPGAIFPDNAFRPAPGNAGRSLNCKVKIRSNSSIVFFIPLARVRAHFSGDDR